jgi:hypothetical protein
MQEPASYNGVATQTCANVRFCRRSSTDWARDVGSLEPQDVPKTGRVTGRCVFVLRLLVGASGGGE